MKLFSEVCFFWRMSVLGEISDSSQGQVSALAVIKDDFGLITVAQDSSVRVWLKRSNGQVRSPTHSLRIHTFILPATCYRIISKVKPGLCCEPDEFFRRIENLHRTKVCEACRERIFFLKKCKFVDFSRCAPKHSLGVTLDIAVECNCWPWIVLALGVSFSLWPVYIFTWYVRYQIYENI